MNFKINGDLDFALHGDEFTRMQVEPLPDQRIFVGDQYIICAPGDRALYHGKRLRLDTFIRIHAACDHDEDIHVTHDHIDYYDEHVNFELMLPKSKRKDLKRAAKAGATITLNINLRDLKPVEGDPTSFSLDVTDSGYLRRLNGVTFNIEQPALEAA